MFSAVRSTLHAICQLSAAATGAETAADAGNPLLSVVGSSVGAAALASLVATLNAS